jgi:integrase
MTASEWARKLTDRRMPTNKLTDHACRNAKPGPKAKKLFDGGGLHLFISPKGAKVWRLAYRLDGKPQTATLGDYPLLTLAEARTKRDGLKKALQDGIAPKRKVTAGQPTLKEATATYWDGRKDVSDGYRDNAKRGIELHLFPKLGNRPIGAITRDELLRAMAALDAEGKHVYVRKVRVWVGQVFDWAVEHRHCEVNPAASINPRKAFGKAEVVSHAAIELPDVPVLWGRLALEGELLSALATRMLAYTWTRTQELRFMEWAEIEGDLWRIPKGKMKRRKDHLVPLTTQALDVLAKMRARSRGSVYVFPAEHRLDRPMSENTVLFLLYRMGYKCRMTGHGFRSIASTWANERGFNKDAIERQLAHSPDDKVRSAYNRAEYLPERRVILQAWADWLEVDASGAQGGELPAHSAAA